MRVFLLRLFGAKIGRGVVVRPGLRVKFPWRLQVGDHCWLGEDVWIDNLAQITLNAHCCLSQGAYLCSGSHNWSSTSFDLIVAPITLAEGAWVGAFCRLAPGSIMEEGAVLTLASMGHGVMDAWSVYQGVPACKIRQRSTQVRGD